MKEIEFFESKTTNYAARTKTNAEYADITFAFAVDFSSKGEVLTKQCVKKLNKIYVPINANDLKITEERILKVIDFINNSKQVNKNIIINIAGNGIYTLKKYSITQHVADSFAFAFLKTLIDNDKFSYKVIEIRTGGQSGFDESGAKAGYKLGIKTSIVSPKGWKFRDVNGIDISDEDKFKKRFEL
jgi:hypothetical protein